MKKTTLTSDKAHIVGVENDLELDCQTIEWECGGLDDRVTSDFEWPGKVVGKSGGEKLNSGWVTLEGSALKVGDTVPLRVDNV